MAQLPSASVHRNEQLGNTIVARYQVANASADVANVIKVTPIITIDQPQANHNGGDVHFGPDGYLYIGMGDGGSAGDPQGNGQNTNVLLGKLLRIDVNNGNPYAIPPSNPWANGQGGRPEIWAFGLRNPWRFSFDRVTHDLYIADVGQNMYEEVDFQPAGSPGGQNYGWNVAEGQHCFRGNCNLAEYTAPIAEYTHAEGCSITGGYVYRGTAFPGLQGAYIFGDYCSGRIWALRRQNTTDWEQAQVLDSKQQISSFGEDEAGELYLTSLANNGLYQVAETGGT